MLIWPRDSVSLREDVQSVQTDALSTLDPTKLSINRTGSALSVSIPAQLDEKQLTKLLLDHVTDLGSFDVEGASVSLTNGSATATVQITRNDSFPVQVSANLTPSVQDGKLYFTINSVKLGLLPIPKSIIVKNIPATFYDSEKEMVVVSLPENYRAKFDSVSIQEEALQLVIGSDQLDFSSPGDFWQSLVGNQ